ncbi:MAG TPA: ATP-binding protein [Polaromonas sp.]|uniref:sensor histidine kinase n=1 Tax=Polaromonas sp. TaxID=1869339 RepID=UPI002D71A73F|nr:ATP-binding protein [Polaromonas sp.]HYW56254.1 ATP-binding protein [Polaromonas sp.]
MKTLKAWLTARFKNRRRSLALASDYLAGQALSSPEVFQAGLELATQGIVLLDENGAITVINRHARELLHSSLENLTGADFWEVIPEELVEEHRSQAELDLQNGGTYTFVGHHAFENQWVEYTLRRHTTGTVINLRDLSDARRTALLLEDSEYANESLFDSNPLGMWLLDPYSKRLIAGNKAASALYGMDQDQMENLALEELFFDGEGEALLSSLPQVAFQQEMRLCTQKKSDGERVLVELACSSVQWLDRPAVLVNVVDVGARHIADGQLRRLNEELERRVEQFAGEVQRTQRELEDFTFAMSNDLKAPLHVVNGFAKTLAEKYSSALDEQGKHYLGRIRVSTQQLAKLIDDLRTLTHLSRQGMNPEPVDMVPVCQRLIAGLRKREPHRKVVLEIAPALALVGDKAQLITALSCLIDNAWKFTSKKDEGWIKVGLMAGEQPDLTVLFVSDNGVGFDAAYAGKLFTAFQRLHSSADFPGGGLGLAIVKRVAEQHGGEVWGTTADNAGASFFMSIPQ